MVFSSLFFIFAYLGIVLMGYYLMKGLPIVFRNCWLVFASLFFYAWGEPKFCIVMVLCIIFNYIMGLLLDKIKAHGGRKTVLILALIGNLFVLFIYKYLSFISSIFNSKFGDRIPLISIALPIGVSFFTFQAISYIVDVYRDKEKVQKNPLYLILYVAFFPQLVAGPIVRYDAIAKQITDRKESVSLFGQGVERFLLGFCKKVFLANSFAVVADAAFQDAWQGETIGLTFAWLGAISYALQIFFDFAGYSDMAIGLGKMFGFHIEENFNFPYMANSISDFWRRWHISLGSWFRDYVYIPLGGSRVKVGRLVFNLFVVWILTGIWHGANWTFVLWGFMYFVLLTFEKLTGIKDKLKYTWQKIIYRLFTLFSILFGWVIFRSATPGTIIRYIKSMFAMNHNGFSDDRMILYLKEYAVFYILAILFCVPIVSWVELGIQKHPKVNNLYSTMKPMVLITCFVVAITYLVVNSYNPFIYFNF